MGRTSGLRPEPHQGLCPWTPDRLFTSDPGSFARSSKRARARFGLGLPTLPFVVARRMVCQSFVASTPLERKEGRAHFQRYANHQTQQPLEQFWLAKAPVMR